MIATALDAAKLFGPTLAASEGEMLAIVYLDASGGLLGQDRRRSSGDIIDLPMREIFRSALNHGAVGLIVAHNHPSGDPRPSAADIQATRRLAETAAGLGIVLHDHLIFAGGQCRSFREMGLL